MSSNLGYESEKTLEDNLIKQLCADGYEFVEINDIDDLHLNFRKQVNKHNASRLNGHELSDKEFERLLVKIQGKGVYGSSKTLRSLQDITMDDGSTQYIELFNTKNNEWCKNEFQVTHQVTMVGKYENRYDVTLLINGLPLVQIELKRRGIDFKEAFNQVIRYKKHSLNDLFRYVQIFIISNGIDTKYFANSDKEMDFQYTFYWTDKNNNRIDNLYDFALDFLPKCHISKMISRYMVVDDTQKNLMVMRPYQYYAVEELMKRAYETNNNAYVWHTTGSGKTLTSFKLSQLLSTNREVAQVFFLVDRKDLDSQTIEEFNRFQKDTVDMTDSTDTLIAQMKDSSKKIILTTIQKMSNACKNDKYQDVIDRFEGKKVVFIIDECHRSQFGEMHKMIKKKFPRAQYFGFTGTPRFAENASQDGRTTADIFEKLVHHYLIKNAIADGNVLGFNVDYVRTISSTVDIEDDEEVEAIDTEEVLMDDQRISNIVDYVLKIHNSKTNNRRYNAIFTVRSIPMLIKYYDEFKKRNTDLKIAGIFTFGANEDGELETEHSRDSLERMIRDYNQMFDKNYSTNTFPAYFTDVSKKVKNTELDILLVVNMFLTGFDAKRLNTLYVDKRLKHHDLIQAFSRTNRLYDQNKEYGQIVTFRSPKEYKKKINDALVLYSKGGIGQAIAEDWETVLNNFVLSLKTIRTFAPTPADVNGLSKKQKKTFIKLFRDLDHDYAHLKSFSTFEPKILDEYGFSQQIYEDYAAVYNNVIEELKKDPPDDTGDEPIRDDYDLVAYSKFKIDFEYIVELLQGFVDFLDQKDIEFNEAEFEHKLLELKEIVKDFAEDNPKLSDLLLQVLDEIEQDKAKFMGQDMSVIINQMRYTAIDKEIEKFSKKWYVPFEAVKYEAYNYKDGELANENKLKELADYATYKMEISEALPKFKFNGTLIREFKEILMPEIGSLIE